MMDHNMEYLLISWLNRNIVYKAIYMLHWFMGNHESFISKFIVIMGWIHYTALSYKE